MAIQVMMNSEELDQCVIHTERSSQSTATHLKLIQGGPKKRGHTLMTIILSILHRFKNFFTGRFLGKFAVKWI